MIPFLFAESPEATAGRHGPPPDVLDGLAAEIRARLRRPPYFTVLRGLDFDPEDVLFSALSARVGRLLQPYPDPGFLTVRPLRPRDSSRAEGWGVLTEHLHTDSTNWPACHDATLMLCTRPDQRGEGLSLVLPLDDAVREIRTRLGAAAIDRLREEPLPWAIDPGLGGGVVRAPALSGDGMRWQLFRVAQAVERDGARCAAPDTMDFLRRVDAALAGSGSVRRFPLAAGDLLIIANRFVLHAREPITDAAGSVRELRHAKVDIPGYRPRAHELIGSRSADDD
ncbi:TauD/TfdA family dioxygenase [Spirillospora sp. NPDC029432]|uniref:TauD/TfdA family dioxygenase n=1 Tax=Spirillospora sp. NPDC029432 TaxID=3154599 RepID=UPI00345519DD